MLVLKGQGNSHPQGSGNQVSNNILHLYHNFSFPKTCLHVLPYLTMSDSVVSCDRSGFDSCRGDLRILLLYKFLVLSGAMLEEPVKHIPNQWGRTVDSWKLQLAHQPGVLLLARGCFFFFFHFKQRLLDDYETNRFSIFVESTYHITKSSSAHSEKDCS